MADSDNTTIFAVLGIAAVGVFMYMKSKGGGGYGGAGAGDYGSMLDEIVASQRQPFGPRVDYQGGATGPIDPTTGTRAQGVISWPLSDKFGVPIIGPSADFDDPRKFDKIAAGNCQCDGRLCCYWAPFYTKTGEKTGGGAARKCTEIFYGDSVTACEKVFDEYTRENAKYNAGVARAYNAMKQSQYMARRPHLAAMANRLRAHRAYRAGIAY